MKTFLNACLPYYGGKTRLVKKIIKKTYEICPNVKIFVDAFAGGSSVSMAAKLNNLQVIANDYSYHSYTINKAIIENNSVKLNMWDIMKVYQTKIENNEKINEVIKVLSEYIPVKMHIEFLAKASYLTNIVSIFNNEYKKHLINALLMKFLAYILPFSAPFNTALKKFFEDKSYDPKYTYTMKAKYILKPTIKIIENLMNKINNAIFDNGQINKSYNLDVLDFFDMISNDIKDVDNTVVYLDPPYKDASKTYESVYKIFNITLFKEPKPTSVFNKLNAKEKIIKLLTYKFNYYIISYAGEYTEQLIKEIEDLGFVVEINKIPFKWSISSLEFDKHKEAYEYLIAVKKK